MFYILTLAIYCDILKCGFNSAILCSPINVKYEHPNLSTQVINEYSLKEEKGALKHIYKAKHLFSPLYTNPSFLFQKRPLPLLYFGLF